MWYPAHSTAFYISVTGEHFTEVSCQGFRGSIPEYQADANDYRNPFDREIALFRTSEGGASRMSVFWGTQGPHVNTATGVANWAKWKALNLSPLKG